MSLKFSFLTQFPLSVEQAVACPKGRLGTGCAAGAPGRWGYAHQPPEVLGGHGDVVVDVAGHLLGVRAQGGRDVVPGKPNSAAEGLPELL